jgi:hypothetical protein
MFAEGLQYDRPSGVAARSAPPPDPGRSLGSHQGPHVCAGRIGAPVLQALFPRTTNRYGCVTLHSYHFYVEEGLPKTQILLWVYGEQLRAVLENVVLAEYQCRYDWRDRKVRDIRAGTFYPTRFASPQQALIPLNPQESLVVYRVTPARRQPRSSSPMRQLWLVELVQGGEDPVHSALM